MTSSILDVAREANVSPSTVSLVVNGKPYVSADTRSQVKAAIRKLRYKPRQRKKLNHIAVVYTRNMIVNGILAEYCRGFIAGIRECLPAPRAQMSIFAGADRISDDLVFSQTLDHHECDGVIIMGAYPRHGYVERVLEAGLPLVTFNRAPEHAEFSAVCVDHHNLAIQAVHHLANHGHRRIATLAGNTESYSGRMLRNGFDAAVKQTGIEVAYNKSFDLTQPTDDQFDSILTDMLESGATAVFAGDPAALRLAKLMEARGLTPGRDLSFLGIDDMGLVTPGGLRITSMGYNKLVMGQIAGQMILQLIQMGDHISHQFTTVQPYLVAGQTLTAISSAESMPADAMHGESA